MAQYMTDKYVVTGLVMFLQEVDGESLLTLDPEMMVKLMNIKAGPSLRIYNKIMQLKKHSFS